MVRIRKAVLGDVPALHEMIGYYAARGLMLPRTLPDLYENIWEFTVAETKGRVAGCGALKLYNHEVAEVRSLCVGPEGHGRGVGAALARQLLREAGQFGLKTVFALTASPGFFSKCGFREVAREKFPLKISRDCRSCPRFACCEEKTMAIELRAGRRRSAEARRELSPVPA